ncbi:MAG: SPFH domain-containing protein [Planctomycetota bacterium]|jgi:regulator of protease activity HflC (stomatin/prohibitin superfamily)
MNTDVLKERPAGTVLPGIPMLILGIALCLTPIWLSVSAIQSEQAGNGSALGHLMLFVANVLAIALVFRGLILVNPNQSKVLILFGRYTGTVRKDGFFWVNPFTVRRQVSLRVHNFNSETLKVNDLRGNPVEIGAVVVWRVHDTALAAFQVEDYESYVAVQSEAAIRVLAADHPYDTPQEGQTSLRGNSEDVNSELKDHLTERLSLAGVEVLEVRISHLAYAPEIAGAMLRRQQAEAIIDARTRIVDGAVGMVQMALEHLRERDVIDLDEERKAAMVSNLLVVLCSEHDATPVVNTGTLYN